MKLLPPKSVCCLIRYCTMNKIGYLGVMMFVILSFQSCNSHDQDSIEATESAASTNGNTRLEGEVDFAVQAAVAGVEEVELSKLALEKSTHAQIKEFANIVIKEHGLANEELKTIAKSKNIALPTALDHNYEKLWDDLNGRTAGEFDKKYAEEMINGQQKILNLFEKEAKDGSDAELKAFAAKNASAFKEHLAKIKKIKDTIK